MKSDEKCYKFRGSRSLAKFSQIQIEYHNGYKACYNKSSALTTSRFIGIATAGPIGFSHPVKCYCVLSLSGTSNGLLLCQTDHIMWHIFLDAATRAFFLGIPLSTSLL